MLHADINQLLTDPPTHGPCSKYEITDTATGDHFVGKITFTFDGQPFKVPLFSDFRDVYTFSY